MAGQKAAQTRKKKLIEKGKLREDLYYRLKVVEIALPPLHERKEDIPELVAYLLEKINRDLRKNVRKVPPEVMKILMNLPWEGNVRELENAFTRAVILDENLALEIGDKKLYPKQLVPLKDVEKDYIQHVLKATNGKKQEQAKYCG